jgi:hypothetical protein
MCGVVFKVLIFFPLQTIVFHQHHLGERGICLTSLHLLDILCAMHAYMLKHKSLVLEKKIFDKKASGGEKVGC